MEATAEVKLQQYDWTEDNYSAIASLRTSLAYKLRKEMGLTPSRSMIAASDQIARDLMTPPKSGQELDQWIGRILAQGRLANLRKASQNGNGKAHSNGNGHGHYATPVSDILSSDAVDFSIPQGLTPPTVTQKHKSEKWSAVIAAMRDSAIGEWKPLLFKDPKDAKIAAGVLGYHARHTLKCVNYGWRLKSKTDRDNPALLWIIKQKVS